MNADELLKKAAALSISQEDIEACLLVFDEGTTAANVEKTAEDLVTCSKKPELAQKILKIYEGNPKTFFSVLNSLSTYNTRIILVNVFSTALSKEQQEVYGLRALNIIRKLLKDVKTDEYQLIRCYMHNYCNIMVNFRLYLPQHIGLFLSFLNPDDENDPVASYEVNTSIVLTIMTLYSEESEETKEQVSDYIEILVDGVDPDTFPTSKFLNFVKIMSLLYTPMSEIIHSIYVKKQTQDIILLKINSILRVPSSLSQPENKQIVREILKLIGDTCVNDQCRDFNATHYLEPIKLATTVDENFLEIKYLATLDLIKLWNFVKIGSEKDKITNINNLLFIVTSFIRKFDCGSSDAHQLTCLEYNVESLSYLSLNESIKNGIREQEDLLEKLIALLDTNVTLSLSSAVLYGIIIIIANLMEPKEKAQTPNERAIQQMKSFTDVSDKKDATIAEINEFNKSMLFNHKIIEKLCQLPSRNELVKTSLERSGQRFNSLYMTIISQITSNQDKQVRQEAFKQGAYPLVSEYLMKNSELIGTSFQVRVHEEDSVITRLNAIRSLARIVISNDPLILAKEKFELTVGVVFLIELLGAPIDQYEGKLFKDKETNSYSIFDKVTNVDKFEGLLALTNLASVDEGNKKFEGIKKIIITKTFDQYLNNFIIESDAPQIQRASWELISNLISEPALMAKFFNVEGASSTQKSNYKRLELLVKLLNSKDESLQITLTGLLANVTSDFPMICEILLQNETIVYDLVTKLIQIFDYQAANLDLIYRSLIIVNNLVSLADPSKLEELKQKTSLQPSIGKLVILVKDKEILLVVIDTLKLMK